MDRALLRRALVDLRVSADDADAVVEDMLLPLRQRAFGHVMHARDYAQARNNIVKAIEFLMRLVADDDGGDHGDPSGNGGSPTH